MPCCVRLPPLVCTYMHTCLQVLTFTCVCTCTYACRCLPSCVYVYAHAHAGAYLHMCVCTCTCATYRLDSYPLHRKRRELCQKPLRMSPATAGIPLTTRHQAVSEWKAHISTLGFGLALDDDDAVEALAAYAATENTFQVGSTYIHIHPSCTYDASYTWLLQVGSAFIHIHPSCTYFPVRLGVFLWCNSREGGVPERLEWSSCCNIL